MTTPTPHPIKQKLEDEILEVTWDALAPHAARGNLLYVSRLLALSDAGLALALDDTKQVQSWLEEGLLYKPSDEALKHWNEQPQKMFKMVIVTPFVLVHELTDEETEALLASNPGD